MRIIRHPDMAGDVKEAAEHYTDISERVLEAFGQGMGEPTADRLLWCSVKHITSLTRTMYLDF